jgi:hypothetical protein
MQIQSNFRSKSLIAKVTKVIKGNSRNQHCNERSFFMPQSEPTCLLIARSVPSDNERLAQLRPLLAQKYGLDAFALQQRLIGRGSNLIARGGRSRLSEIATLLTERGIRCKIVEA